jgi:hypothetical protein
MKIFEITTPLNEDASAGATATGSVAAVVGTLGSSVKDLVKKQKGYTNIIKRNPVAKVK